MGNRFPDEFIFPFFFNLNNFKDVALNVCSIEVGVWQNSMKEESIPHRKEDENLLASPLKILQFQYELLLFMNILLEHF